MGCRERPECKARRGLTTAAYMEIREDCGVAQRCNQAAQKNTSLLDEALDEGKSRVGHLAPAMVDGEGMAAVGDLHDLRHAGVVLLSLEARPR